jgi:hypothetical protein
MPKSNSTRAKNDDLKWTQAALVLVAVGMIFGAILST